MSTIYVVLSESGEYSERRVWVSGAYTTELAARSAIAEALERRRLRDQWDGRFEAIAGPESWVHMTEKKRQMVREEAERLLNPSKPPEEEVERARIIEVELDRWVNP